MNVNESVADDRILKLGILQNISIIQDIKYTAGNLKNYLYVDNEYKMCDHQSMLILKKNPTLFTFGQIKKEELHYGFHW